MNMLESDLPKIAPYNGKFVLSGSIGSITGVFEPVQRGFQNRIFKVYDTFEEAEKNRISYLWHKVGYAELNDFQKEKVNVYLGNQKNEVEITKGSYSVKDSKGKNVEFGSYIPMAQFGIKPVPVSTYAKDDGTRVSSHRRRKPRRR